MLKPEGAESDATMVREQLIAETSAMAAFALSTGLKVPPPALKVVGAMIDAQTPLKIEDVAQAHELLTQLVAPTSPGTVLALTDDTHKPAMWRKRSSVALTRKMMALAVASLITFVGLSLSPSINDPKYANIFEASGLPLLINELFFLSAAALGASFAALSQIDRHVTYGTFDARQQSSYWTRFLLGIIAGLLLATLIDVRSSGADGADGGSHLSTAGLALVGGFSSTVVYRILNRLVETLETMVKGGGEEVAHATQHAAQVRSGTQALKDRMKVATRLSKLQRDLSAGMQGAGIGAQLDALTRELLQDESVGATEKPSAAPAATSEEGASPPAGQPARDDDAVASASAEGSPEATKDATTAATKEAASDPSDEQSAPPKGRSG